MEENPRESPPNPGVDASAPADLMDAGEKAVGSRCTLLSPVGGEMGEYVSLRTPRRRRSL